MRKEEREEEEGKVGAEGRRGVCKTGESRQMTQNQQLVSSQL